MLDKLTSILGFLGALSLATERITETIKGLLPGWLALEKASGSKGEELRKAGIHIAAIGIGTALAWATKDQLSSLLGLHYAGFWAYLVFGAMASGGSGLWNSALDIVREINKQKQQTTNNMKKALPPGGKP